MTVDFEPMTNAARAEYWRGVAERALSKQHAMDDLLTALKDAMRSARKDFDVGATGELKFREAYAEQIAAIARAEALS